MPCPTRLTENLLEVDAISVPPAVLLEVFGAELAELMPPQAAAQVTQTPPNPKERADDAA